MADALTELIRSAARTSLQKDLDELGRIVALAAALHPSRSRFTAQGYALRLSLRMPVPSIRISKYGRNASIWWCANYYRYQSDRLSRRGNVIPDVERDLGTDPVLAAQHLLNDLDAGRLYLGCGWHGSDLVDFDAIDVRSLSRIEREQERLARAQPRQGTHAALDRVAKEQKPWWQRMLGE